MIRMLWIALAFTLSGEAFAASPDPATLVVAPVHMAKARALIRHLGSEVYRERDQATRDLEAMGRLALIPLGEARSDPDPEVQSRVAWLYSLALADDIQARIDTFLADSKSKYKHDLPGWFWFQYVAGDHPATRELFSEIVKNRANQDLLLGLGNLPADKALSIGAVAGSIAILNNSPQTGVDLHQAILNRRLQLQQQMMTPFPRGSMMQQPKLPELALMFLAESLVPEREMGVINGSQIQLANYLYQQPMRESLNGRGQYGVPFQKLVHFWLETREGVVGISQAMGVAQSCGMEKAQISKFAVKLIGSPLAREYNRALGVSMIARNETKEYLHVITGLFNDEGPLARGNVGNPRPDINLQDFALAMAVILTGQKLKDYGFEEVNAGYAAMKFSYTNYYFPKDTKMDTEARRAAAFEKWRTWESSVYGSLAGPAIVAASMETRYTVKPAKK